MITKFNKYILTGILAVISFRTFPHKGQNPGNGCYIEWHNKPLKHKDFKGKADHKNAVASTVYSIHKEIKENKDGSLTVCIKTYFLCDMSWMLKDTCGSDVLPHEQKHFDIAEIFARKLRKQLQQIEVKDQKDADLKLNALYQTINKEMDVYQDQYDKETEHSENGKQQRIWNEKISIALNELKEYKRTDFTLNKESKASAMNAR